jgi:short subunit dehydrogenase-like uncharacterized protein
VPAGSREYDLVLFGASGFTGQLVATYLAAHQPAGLRWALGGRNRSRLENVRNRLLTARPAAGDVGVVTADSSDPSALDDLARSTRVVASTVGPYLEYGERLVAACAAHGTDYADISGEPEFIDAMWLRYHRRATETGSRLVHCCGFDSVPPDLGAWWTLRSLPAGEPIVMRAYVSASGSISAGTYVSAISSLGRTRQRRETAARRKAAEIQPAGRHIASLKVRPHRNDRSGRWAVPLPTIDPLVVRRSASACDEYGPDFRYGHFADVGTAAAMAASVGSAAGVAALSNVPLARTALLRLRTPGTGPTASRRARSWFRVRFVATAGEHIAHTQVSGGDPGYDETAKMLGESAMCLALDDLPARSGQLTPVQAMGPALLDRLVAAGIEFRVLDGSGR